jgi:hypothetical protein
MHDESHPASARRLGEIRAIRRDPAGWTGCRERLRRLLAERSPEALERLLRGFGARDPGRPGRLARLRAALAPATRPRRGDGELVGAGPSCCAGRRIVRARRNR